MRYKYTTQAFVLILALLMTYFATVALYRLYRYHTFTKTTQATAIDFKPSSSLMSIYTPFASYTYVVNDKEYQGTTELSTPTSLNSTYLMEEFKRLKEKKWIVWYSPKNPYYSTLEKEYPTNSIVKALALAGLLLYFLGVALYIKYRSP